MTRRSLLRTFAAVGVAPAAGVSLEGQIKTLRPTAQEFETARAWPKVQQALGAKRDLWGEQAMRLPEGPSYEFFADRLPLLRYVHAAFRHYPIVLSAPGSSVKARLVSNGSGINARANAPGWNDVGFPVIFNVGEDEAPFGEVLSQLNGPRYAEGYLPIVQIGYRTTQGIYSEEVFAAVEPQLAEHGAIFVRFGLNEGVDGTVAAFIAYDGAIQTSNGTLRDATGRALVAFDERCKWDASGKKLIAAVASDKSATLAIFTRAFAGSPPSLTASIYKEHRKKCAEAWQSLLGRGIRLEVPEPLVNNAWRALVVGIYTCLKGDQLCYSIGNSYETQYEEECGQAVRALLLYGSRDDARRMIIPLLDFISPGKGLQFWDAAFKVQLLVHYYWLTHDAGFVRGQRPRWERQVDLLLDSRQPATGILPRENYAGGDILTQVHNLATDANAWRGIRDLGAVLEEIGDREMARHLAREASVFRKSILAAVEKSERRDVQPPFIPVALFGEEKPYQVLTESTRASYWNLMAPYLTLPEIFGVGSVREAWILDTLHERGGIAMGMLRFHQHSSVFANQNGLDDGYSLGYVLTLLKRDEVDRALVSFYGKLAQGLTRDTFIGAEGTGLVPLDQFGRPMYLPPNSYSNAFFLWMLRYLLLQDWDTDDDGKPDTLRLLFATPRRWLKDGAYINVERAPTAFGEVSLSVNSRLKRGEVVAEIQAPERMPRRTLLRLRLPLGWAPVSVEASGQPAAIDEKSTIDVSGLKGKFSVRLKVQS